MERILVTAFEPFGGDSINPTELVLNALPDEIGGAELVKLLLPVEFIRAADITCAEYFRALPGAVVCLGQAGGRRAITPELYGVNLMDARIPDNAGYQPKGERVIPDGAETLKTRLPVWDMIARMRSIGVPAEISFSAGRYVCNSLLYGVLSKLPEAVPCGFIHVPFIRGQVEGVPGRENMPFMELEDIVRGIRAALTAI